MASIERTAAACSVSIRALSYIFLRWFPGPMVLPMSIFTLFAVYVPSFLITFHSAANKPGPLQEIETETRKSELRLQVGTESVDVQEVVSINEISITSHPAPTSRARDLLRTLVLGLPSPTSLFLTVSTFLVNVLVVALAADMLLTARLLYPAHDVSFVRLGHVSQSEARFVLREPDQAKMPVSLQIRIKDAQPPFDDPSWHAAGGVRWTAADTDFTASLTVPLWNANERTYEWKSSNNHSGEFLTPPKPGAVSEYHNGTFTFLATSCILPRFPYNPLDHPLSIPGLRHLANLLPSLGAKFMLFMGDFIYIDVPQRFGTSAEEYRQKYRQVYASPDWPAVSQNLSWIHVFDDHEISNDWSANTTGVYSAAVNAWQHYNADANPPRARAAQTNKPRGNATYYEFAQGPLSFFLLDTRTYRSDNQEPADLVGKTMLGKDQLEDLLYWLNRPEPSGVTWKIVVSSVPFTKNWPVNRLDTWGGFLAERQTVLEAMWDAGARGMGVLILSGDRHEFAATSFPPPEGSKWPRWATPYEFSASPLNQFASPLPTYKQVDDGDALIKYIHNGNSKFGALSFVNQPGNGSVLHYRLFVDGVEAWNYTLSSPPIKPARSSDEPFWSRLLSKLTTQGSGVESNQLDGIA